MNKDDQENTSTNNEFEINIASRVLRLPPYLFGRINNMLYQLSLIHI